MFSKPNIEKPFFLTKSRKKRKVYKPNVGRELQVSKPNVGRDLKVSKPNVGRELQVSKPNVRRELQVSKPNVERVLQVSKPNVGSKTNIWFPQPPVKDIRYGILSKMLLLRKYVSLPLDIQYLN